MFCCTETNHIDTLKVSHMNAKAIKFAGSTHTHSYALYFLAASPFASVAYAQKLTSHNWLQIRTVSYGELWHGIIGGVPHAGNSDANTCRASYHYTIGVILYYVTNESECRDSARITDGKS